MSRTRWPVTKGRSGGSRRVTGRRRRTGHGCARRRGMPPSGPAIRPTVSATVKTPPRSSRRRPTGASGGTRTRWRSGPSGTVPRTSPGPTTSPTARPGVNGHARSGASGATRAGPGMAAGRSPAAAVACRRAVAFRRAVACIDRVAQAGHEAPSPGGREAIERPLQAVVGGSEEPRPEQGEERCPGGVDRVADLEPVGLLVDLDGGDAPRQPDHLTEEAERAHPDDVVHGDCRRHLRADDGSDGRHHPRRHGSPPRAAPSAATPGAAAPASSVR